MSPSGEGTGEDAQDTKQQAQYLEQDSMNSTRNALRLGAQPEILANTENYRDVPKGQSHGAEDKTEAQLSARNERRKRFHFEATASNDEMEDEPDDNLDEVSDVVERLKALKSAMGVGQELDGMQNKLTVCNFGNAGDPDVDDIRINADRLRFCFAVTPVYILTHLSSNA